MLVCASVCVCVGRSSLVSVSLYVQPLRGSLLHTRSLPVSGNTTILNGFPVLYTHPFHPTPLHLPAQPSLACISFIPLPFFSLLFRVPPLHCALFLLPLINTQYSLLSTPHVIHIWLADKLWMLASHITSKISIVFVNGWSILHLASCLELPVLPLSVHFHPWSPLPFFCLFMILVCWECLWCQNFMDGNLPKKPKHPIQVCTLL